jgi:biotin transport system substrate-specific component
MAQARTLMQAAFGPQSLGAQALIVLGGSVLIALSARASVPMWPVPMSLQTLAVILIGLTAGPRLGAAAVLAYLAQGFAGLPVGVNGAAGPAWLFGPTAGFLWGFVALAYAAGWLSERGVARGFWLSLAGVAAISVALYVPGVLWLTAVTPLTLARAAEVGMLPFLAGDAVKAVIAALAVSGAWAAVGRNRA